MSTKVSRSRSPEIRGQTLTSHGGSFGAVFTLILSCSTKQKKHTHTQKPLPFTHCHPEKLRMMDLSRASMTVTSQRWSLSQGDAREIRKRIQGE